MVVPWITRSSLAGVMGVPKKAAALVLVYLMRALAIRKHIVTPLLVCVNIALPNTNMISMDIKLAFLRVVALQIEA
jgi:hypothetical protein